MSKRDFNYRKSLLQTSATGLLICLSWAWLFRDERATYQSLTEALRYNTWSAGFHLWLSSLNMGPWLLLACLIVPVPLVLASKGERFLAPAIISTGYLVGMMWLTDFCNDGNSFRSWFFTSGLFRLTFLFMPVTTAFLACEIVPNLYGLMALCIKPREQGRVMRFSIADALKIIALLALNVACVFAAILASKWLKEHELGPFFQGFWHGSAVFLNAPASLFRVYANIPTPILLLGWAGFLLVVGALIVWRTGQPRAVFRFLSLGLAVSGVSMAWLAGDVVFNYSSLLGGY